MLLNETPCHRRCDCVGRCRLNMASARAAHDRAALLPADCGHAWRRPTLRRRRTVNPLAHLRDADHRDFLDLVEERRLAFQASRIADPARGPQELPGHALQIGLRRVLILPMSPSRGMLVNAPGAAAAEFSKPRNAASSRARAAKNPHPGILSLRHLARHCDERLAHEYDIGRRARYRDDA